MVDNTRLLLRTTLITTFIFLLGIIIGFSIDDLRSRNVYHDLQQSELDEQSFLIEQEFFNQLGTYDCTVAQSRLRQLSYQLGELGYYLVNFEKKNIFKQEEYDYLLRKYFLSEIRVYSLFTNLKTSCQLNNTLILYFFTPHDTSSERQGRILDVLVEKNPSASVFSLNADYGADLLLNNVKQYYNITTTPTLIINDVITKEGVIDLDELESLITGEQ